MNNAYTGIVFDFKSEEAKEAFVQDNIFFNTKIAEQLHSPFIVERMNGADISRVVLVGDRFNMVWRDGHEHNRNSTFLTPTELRTYFHKVGEYEFKPMGDDDVEDFMVARFKDNTARSEYEGLRSNINQEISELVGLGVFEVTEVDGDGYVCEVTHMATGESVDSFEDYPISTDEYHYFEVLSVKMGVRDTTNKFFSTERLNQYSTIKEGDVLSLVDLEGYAANATANVKYAHNIDVSPFKVTLVDSGGVVRGVRKMDGSEFADIKDGYCVIPRKEYEFFQRITGLPEGQVRVEPTINKVFYVIAGGEIVSTHDTRQEAETACTEYALEYSVEDASVAETVAVCSVMRSASLTAV